MIAVSFLAAAGFAAPHIAVAVVARTAARNRSAGDQPTSSPGTSPASPRVGTRTVISARRRISRASLGTVRLATLFRPRASRTRRPARLRESATDAPPSSSPQSSAARPRPPAIIAIAAVAPSPVWWACARTARTRNEPTGWRHGEHLRGGRAGGRRAQSGDRSISARRGGRSGRGRSGWAFGAGFGSGVRGGGAHLEYVLSAVGEDEAVGVVDEKLGQAVRSERGGDRGEEGLRDGRHARETPATAGNAAAARGGPGMVDAAAPAAAPRAEWDEPATTRTERRGHDDESSFARANINNLFIRVVASLTSARGAPWRRRRVPSAR